MKSNYKKLGPFIKEICMKNKNAQNTHLLGVSISKCFMPSIANIIGTDLSTYKVVKKNQFAYGPVTSRNGDKISIALLEDDECIISTSYTVFEIKDTNELDPEYLMMWFRRPEFDRYARFMSQGSVREIFGWEELCDVELPVPSIEEQRAIVAEYNTVQTNIKNNEKIIETLESTANAIYKEWFVDFNFPDENGNPYKKSGGKMVYNPNLEKEIPEGWEDGSIGNYAKVKSGYAFYSSSWQSWGIPVIKIGSIQNKKITINQNDYVSSNFLEKVSKYVAKPCDVVIAMTGATIGKFSFLPSCYNEYLINQRVGIFDLGKKPVLKLPFLYISLDLDSVQNEIKSIGGNSAQENISNIQIENIPIVFNEKTINDFNEKCSKLFKEILLKYNKSYILSILNSLLLSKMSSSGGENACKII